MRNNIKLLYKKIALYKVIGPIARRLAPYAKKILYPNSNNNAINQIHKVDLPNHDYYSHLYEKFDTDKPIAIYVPRWRGVAMSTQSLFEQCLQIPQEMDGHPDAVTGEHIEQYAEIILASGGRHFVISGGSLFNILILHRVLQRDPSIRFDLLWHSNYLYMSDAQDWNILKHWLYELVDGNVHRIGVVKEGLENWFQGLGIDAVHIPNIVPIDTQKLKSTEIDDQVGIWLSHHRKEPYAMLMATKMLPGVMLNASGLDDIGMQIISNLNIPFRHVYRQAIPRVTLEKEMKATGLTLYVTLSECSPMLPLESFALGIPCLVGPASHIFRDHEELRNRLVVEKPLSPEEIADKARAALYDQHHIVDLFKHEFYPALKQQVDERMERFIQ